jgi:hypothetical protein
MPFGLRSRGKCQLPLGHDLANFRGCRIRKREHNYDERAHKLLDEWMADRKPIYDSRNGDRPPIHFKHTHDVLLVTGAI